MSVLFALVVSLCTSVAMVLFVIMWLDRDFAGAVALAFSLLPLLVLTMMAWGESL